MQSATSVMQSSTLTSALINLMSPGGSILLRCLHTKRLISVTPRVATFWTRCRTIRTSSASSLPSSARRSFDSSLRHLLNESWMPSNARFPSTLHLAPAVFVSRQTCQIDPSENKASALQHSQHVTLRLREYWCFCPRGWCCGPRFRLHTTTFCVQSKHKSSHCHPLAAAFAFSPNTNLRTAIRRPQCFRSLSFMPVAGPRSHD